MGVFGMFAVLYGRRLFSSVFAITEMRDMGLYEMPLSCVFFGFWDRDYVILLPCGRCYVFVKSRFNIVPIGLDFLFITFLLQKY